MGKTVFDKIYQVEEKDGVFELSEMPQTDLEPKFLARNSEDGELFLLFGNHGSYSLLKGSIEKGLRFCKAKQSTLFGDCFAFVFQQDDLYGTITDPDAFPREAPSFNSMFAGSKLVKLEVLKFNIAD